MCGCVGVGGGGGCLVFAFFEEKMRRVSLMKVLHSGREGPLVIRLLPNLLHELMADCLVWALL